MDRRMVGQMDERMARMKGWLDGCLVAQINVGWIVGWLNRQMDERLARTEGQILNRIEKKAEDKCMKEWDRQMDARIGWMDAWDK